jgi:cytochrome c-type biogenesis protein CcmH
VSGFAVALALALAAAPRAQTPAQPATAADSAIEARVSRLATVLRCPVCQGVSIQNSPAELSQQMRALVREQVVSGKSDDEVKAWFVARYGEWILLEPKPTGFNLLVYLLPALALIGGGLLVMRVVKRWTSPSPETSHLPPRA